jgi:hypothetical protein
MGYLGYKPADKPLTAADITDSIITSAKIVDGTIVNADINASAAIAGTKISGSFGKVLQVVSTFNSTNYSTSSASYQDGFSASITPSSASNKILVIGHTGSCDSDTAGNNITITVFRDATDLAAGNFFAGARFESANALGNISFVNLDSPNTTSSTTYTVKFKKGAGGGTVYLNNSGKNSITLMEIAV